MDYKRNDLHSARATSEQSSGTHTPGPWRIHDTGSIYSGPLYVASTVGESEQANARRIVACVNACEGVSTKALELLAAGGKISFGNLEAERDRLAEQVRRLREALEFIREESARREDILDGADGPKPNVFMRFLQECDAALKDTDHV